MKERELDEIQRFTGDKQDEYIKDTGYNQQDIATEESFEFGTIKINRDYAEQAIIAMKGRIEGTEEYTAERLEQINTNYEYFENKAMIKQATHQIFIPEIRNACYDWIDDLFEIFKGMGDSIKVKGKENVLERHIVKKAEVDESEDEGPEKFLRSFLRTLKEEGEMILEDEDKDKLQALVEDDVYYFKLLDVVKEFLKDNLTKADFRVKLADLLESGIISGMFVVKGNYEQRTTKALKLFEKGAEDGFGFGAFKEEVESESFYNFHVVNPRNLIFRKDKLDWMIEKVDYNFWQLVNTCLGVDNKPKKNSLYDYPMLESIKDRAFKQTPLVEDENGDTDISAEDVVKKLDADIMIYEGHMIPFRYKVADLMKRKDGKQFTKISNSSEITLPSIVVAAFIDDKFYPIRIQPEPTGELPYKAKTLFTKDRDVAGMGLPEVLKTLQDMVNTNYNLFQDLLDMANKGIVAIDEDKIANPEVLTSLQAGSNIKLKDAQGMGINDIIQFFRPDLGTLGAVIQVFELLSHQMDRTSRAGSSGEKITPNPTATEAFNMIKELEKSVNRVGMTINDMWKELLEDMYKYSLLTRQKDFMLKLVGYRLGKQNVVDPMLGVEQEIATQTKVTKWIEVSPKEIFIDGINFDITALEDAEKQAVENQQLLQFINTLKANMLDMNPDGSPKVYKDDTDQDVMIDMYALIDNLAQSLGQNDVWKKVRPDTMPPMPQQMQNGGSPSSVPRTTPTPNLGASSAQGDVLGGSLQV